MLGLDPAPPARRGARGRIASDLETSAGSDRRHRDAHYRVYAESVRNLGTPVFPRALFEAALDEFGDDADILIVWKDGRPLAALLNFYFNGTCQPYWGGGTARGAAMARQRPHLLRGDAPRHRARLHPRRFRPLQDRHRRLGPQEDLGLRGDAAHLCGPHRRRRGAARGQSARARIPAQDRRLAAAAALARQPGRPDHRAGAGLMPRNPLPRPPHPLSAGPRRQDPLVARAAASRPRSAGSISPASPTTRRTPPICRAARGAGRVARRGPCRGPQPRQDRAPGCARCVEGRPVSLSLFDSARICAPSSSACSRRGRSARSSPFRARWRSSSRTAPGSASSWTSSTSIRPNSRICRRGPGPMRWVHRREAREAVRLGEGDRRARRRLPVRQRGRSGAVPRRGGPRRQHPRALQRHRSRLSSTRTPISRRSPTSARGGAADRLHRPDGLSRPMSRP